MTVNQGQRVRSQFELLRQELLSAGAQSGTFTSDVLDKMTYNTCTVQVTVSAVGSTPTSTVKLEGSLDGNFWFSVPYRTPASDTSANTDLTITAVGSYIFYIDPKYVRFLRARCTANTNVTFSSVLAAAVF